MRPILVAACLIVVACSKSRTSTGPDAGAPPASSIDPATFAAKFAHPCDLLQRSDAEAIEMHFRLHDEGTFIDGFVHDHNLTPCRDIRHGTAGYRCTCENRQSLP